MSKEQFHELTLHLDDIQDLFADPEPGSDRYVSGMDYLYSEVRISPRHEKFKVTIELPPEKIAEGLLERTRAKIKRYCQFKVEQSHKELIALHHEGVSTLWKGLIVLVVCLTLAVIITLISQSGINKILEAALQVLGTLFVLSAGWVALWEPAENFLYLGWPLRRDIRIYNQIADADFVIRESEVEAYVGDKKVEQGLNLA
ncbi:MAG TPA: hypothetical protein VEL69_02480 [Ktedonobacteraceae bacterium]|nr:hypothetical protein [Ktedonobacteraceae bacterium]